MIKGICPCCQGKLILGNENLICENGDYEVPLSIFENRWEQYETDWLLLTEKLVEDLTGMNLRGSEETIT